MSASVAAVVATGPLPIGRIAFAPGQGEIEGRYRHSDAVPVTVDGRAAPGMLRHVFGGLVPTHDRALDLVPDAMLILGVGRRKQRGGMSYRERQRRGRKAAGR